MNIEPYRDEIPPYRESLDGGATLLSLPIDTVHSVALGVWLRTGTQDEADGLQGLTHFLEHMVFKGTETRSAFEIAEGFDRLGAAIDAFTTKDHVAFTLRVLPEYLDPACELLADMLLRPAFEPGMIALEKNVVCEEIQEVRDTPEDHLNDAFAARLYDGHPRGRPILGSRQAVLKLDADILRSEHARLFAGQNLVIAVAGNLQPDARNVVMRYFGQLADSGSRTSGVPIARPPGGEDPGGERTEARPDRLRLTSPIVQSYFEIGNLGVSYRHSDRMPLIMLANILGGGMSSRIFQAVREREGLAYTVYTYSDMGYDIGLVSSAGSCSPENIKRLEEVVRAEYATLLSDGVSEQELANNRAQIKSQLVFSLEGVTNQMYRAAKNELYYGRFIPVTEIIDKIDSVDQENIVRCADRYFDPDHVVVATHGPA